MKTNSTDSGSAPVRGLGIESSCDETSVAVVADGRRALANVIFSQIDAHAPFRGVVPEIASRAHLEKINHLYEEALRRAEIGPADLDYVAVTVCPGLIGSLMVGAQFAKCLALVHDLPVILVDHLEAHLYAPCLDEAPLEKSGSDPADRATAGYSPVYPFLGLLLSGGNSAIYRVDGPGRMTLLGDTMDDACGEAFDKIATLLDLPYPGGPHIEAAAREYEARPDTEAFAGFPGHAGDPQLGRNGLCIFPRLLRNLRADQLAFSFSGIKTAVARAHREGIDPGRICRDFQQTAFELVERNLRRAVQQTGIARVVASGGVLANGFLRERLATLRPELAARGGSLTWPEQKFLCTDNAGMIAAAGYYLRDHPGFRADRLDFGVASKRYLPIDAAS
ncbi:MAG: tRNA (adenosine(37)-N6)-threonylcarbamoyltransferase complex transferase subunit TsaD [bacterium]|nr:tRNA (adenosine(37)-N6)-threonylcarbamoyltransferase complex transferase subunit TsaD [bacterium]